MTQNITTALREKIAAIRLLICDVDGVLTDGKLYFNADGLETKAFNIKDGQGMVSLLKTGVEIAIITGRYSSMVEKRMDDLGVKYVFQGQEDKIAAFEELLATLSVKPEQVAYLGDDLPDLPLIQRVGFGCAVQDAAPILLEHADWVTTLAGGHGAARELCDLIMQTQGSFDKVVACYLS